MSLLHLAEVLHLAIQREKNKKTCYKKYITLMSILFKFKQQKTKSYKRSINGTVSYFVIQMELSDQDLIGLNILLSHLF